jgi:hypothetical protein
MKLKRYFPRQRALSIATQVAVLKSAFPQGRLTRTNDSIEWVGSLAPLESSREYQVRMSYKLGGFPAVFVLSPDLRELTGERRLPHCYDQEKQKLCLFYPKDRKWTPQMALAATVMKWTLAWLTFFEIWLSTDIWFGRGIGHPGDDPSSHSI